MRPRGGIGEVYLGCPAAGEVVGVAVEEGEGTFYSGMPAGTVR